MRGSVVVPALAASASAVPPLAAPALAVPAMVAAVDRRADEAQRRASDPAVSAFVAASAGSGKTKLLTDRLLRLMLGGAEPARILCLTFTKAAAAEMAIRLQNRLSRWVTAGDDRLDSDLAGFDLVPDARLRSRARALFADVLDLPGGMRIGTIHAFCQSLLRRFPLEAQLSPHFRLLEDSDAEQARRESREAMLAGAHTDERRRALTALAGLVSLDGFGRLVARLESDPVRFGLLATCAPDDMIAALDRVTGADRSKRLADIVGWPGEAELRDTALVMRAQGSPTAAAFGQELLDWLAILPSEREEHWPQWRCLFMLATEPRKLGKHVNPKLANAHPELRACLEREQERIFQFEDCGRAADVADISAALLHLASPVAAFYAARKEQTGNLDFSDLINRTNRLLETPGAEWVRYKLDGGLDHLLLDEVQDTAPEQWQIAAALTDDFFSGAGSNATDGGGRRTIFAVGDRKQSIYSFQGADPDSFEIWRRRFSDRAGASFAPWRDVELHVSFRSTAPVLALVDAVFVTAEAAAGVSPDETMVHEAHRRGHAGRVELWPLTPRPDDMPPEPWRVPDKNLGGISAQQRLADALSDWIKAQTDGSVALESRGRPLAPGDVLILVRRRGDFARSLVRALKRRGVPVAGIDRMVLTEQPAVADLLALCDALLLPQDDLQFACMLTSPLGGLTDESLMELAMGREASLWDTLRARANEHLDWGIAAKFFDVLLARVDFASAHGLLSEALGPLGGRARLLGRLGPDAAEPIDELIGAAIAYAANHAPSLQGFVHALRESKTEIKREAEEAGHLVRVMTVHGAKGLQAPLVILPDTTSLPPDEGSLMWTTDAVTGREVPIWSPQSPLRCRNVDQLRLAAAARQIEEQNRLLYVAMTRAEDRLLICGWMPRHAPSPKCWYERVRQGFAVLPGVAASEFDALERPWEGTHLSFAAPQTVLPVMSQTVRDEGAQPLLPAWAGAAPNWQAGPIPAEAALSVSLAPSRPADAEFGVVPAATSPLAARDFGKERFQRGRLIHALLQHLPTIDPLRREEAARRYLHRPGSGVSADAVETLVTEVMAVLAHPALAPLFGPFGRAEVPLTGVVGGSVIGGLVDRLAIMPPSADGRIVLVADYKTNRTPPIHVDRTPVLYLRQMAAYRAVLVGALPGYTVHCTLVWTVGPVVTPLPEALLHRYAPGVLSPISA